MKILARHIIWLIATAICGLWLSSCSDEREIITGSGSEISGIELNADGSMTLGVNLEIPEMMTPGSRAMGENPNFSSLSLYVLVFEDETGLRHYDKVEATTVESDGTHGHDALVTFKLTLKPTDGNTTIHLIATDQPDIEGQIVYGPEDRVIAGLFTDNNHEAYWQRIDLGSYIPSADRVDPQSDNFDQGDADRATTIYGKLRHVAMVRNFSRVSVKLSPEAQVDFQCTGIYVMNTVDRGTVAPYVASNPEGSRFISYYKEVGGKYEGLTYNELTAMGHVGNMPVGTQVENMEKDPTKITSKSETQTGVPAPVYFYERPSRETWTERTYVIIRGLYKGTEGFYKIDLGNVKEDDVVGIFEYYNLLRNFDFAITLNRVEAAGYKTFEEACNGAVYNNFSASVEARNMKSISDGEDMIFVNMTSYVFCYEDEMLEVLAQFREKIANGGGTERNDLLSFKLSEGDVVKGSVTEEKHHDASGSSFDEWNKYILYGTEPTNDLREQTLYIYRGNKANPGEPVNYGLYRAITLFSHKPWTFEDNHVDIVPGLYKSTSDVPGFEWQKEYREIGQGDGSPITLFFELPAGLPQAIFPLEFTIEADRQNIQNAYVGNAVVKSVKASESLFYKDGAQDNPTTTRIQYVKTVTWEEYNTDKTTELTGKGSRVIDCQFLTITDLGHDAVGDENDKTKSTTNVRIRNKYFGSTDEVTGEWLTYTQDGFNRDNKTSDPSPRFWDFNSHYWDMVLMKMNSTTRDIYTTVNNSRDELIFVDGGTRTLKSYAETRGNESIRYMQTTNANDRFMSNFKYSTQHTRTLRVEVMSTSAPSDTEAAATSLAPRVVVTGTGMTSPGTYTSTREGDPYQYYVYEINVPQNATEFSLSIYPATGTPQMRFYVINIYPRWDEMNDE